MPKTMIDELATFESSYVLLFFNWRYYDGMDVPRSDCPPVGYISLTRVSIDGNAQYKV